MHLFNDEISGKQAPGRSGTVETTERLESDGLGFETGLCGLLTVKPQASQLT